MDEYIVGLGESCSDSSSGIAWGTSRPPLASVIVATYNRAKELGVTLETLLTQETDFPYEVIVVDNNSSDDTKALTTGLEQRDGRVHYLFAPRRDCPTLGTPVSRPRVGRYLSLRTTTSRPLLIGSRGS